MTKISPIPPDFRISARTLRVVWDAMLGSVQAFAGLKFRGRKLGNEAFVNVAVWHFAELPRPDQEAILRAYLPRLERHLSDDSPALAPQDGATSIRMPEPPRVDSHPENRDVRDGSPLSKGKGRRKGSA